MRLGLIALYLGALLAFSGCTGLRPAKSLPSDGPPLAVLQAGNQRFQQAEHDAAQRATERRLATTRHQEPLAVIVGCADSRVAPELIFDQTLGDLFVIRTAGNVVDDYALASIEYAVSHLGTRLVVVLGHEQCGAIHAAMGKDLGHGHVALLLRDLQPAVQAVQGQPGDAWHNAVRENARQVARKIAKESHLGPLASETKVLAAVYSLDTGAVTWLAD